MTFIKLIISFFVAGVVFFVIVILSNPLGEQKEYEFVSPSGKIRLILRESCLGIACSHVAEVDSGILPFINRKSCKRYSADGFIFSNIEVKWLKGESVIWWKEKDSLSKPHLIDINHDCKK